jgi:Fe2+ or Zn2+ uptake regulation protein
VRTSSVDKVILDILSQEHAHLTSLQVYEEIRLRLPAVNPSTVYRALERLASFGQVSVSDMGTGSAVYELLAENAHHHLVCRKCGGVTTMGEEDVQNFFHLLEEKNNFHITSNHLVLFGICAQCG